MEQLSLNLEASLGMPHCYFSRSGNTSQHQQPQLPRITQGRASSGQLHIPRLYTGMSEHHHAAEGVLVAAQVRPHSVH